jgi:pimeloyl-ACP methyl ester carboxylesterase
MQTFIADDGERLQVRVRGEGSPLILLHGWTSSHTIWNALPETLHRQHRVFCPDARGHGGHDLIVNRTPPGPMAFLTSNERQPSAISFPFKGKAGMGMGRSKTPTMIPSSLQLPP